MGVRQQKRISKLERRGRNPRERQRLQQNKFEREEILKKSWGAETTKVVVEKLEKRPTQISRVWFNLQILAGCVILRLFTVKSAQSIGLRR